MDRLEQEFFRIAKLPHDGFTKDFLNRCQSHTVKVQGKFYKYYQSGSGPTVLHVHGIRSNLGSMATIAGTLLEQKYQVVLFDAPAHGEALGTATDPLEVRELIGGIAERFPGLHAVVGHSLGGLWAMSAWNTGLRAKALVSISSPASMRFVLDRFAEFTRMDGDQVQELARRIEGRLGEDVWTAFSPTEVATTIDAPGLIIHGANDDYVPPGQAQEIHSSWRRSTVQLIDDAGHTDIVGSPKVQKLISTYLQDVA